LILINQFIKLVKVKVVKIGAFEAKTHLSELLEKVRHGAVYFITKRGELIAELRPVTSPHRRPTFGADRGRIKISEDFDAPIPEMKEYGG